MSDVLSEVIEGELVDDAAGTSLAAPANMPPVAYSVTDALIDEIRSETAGLVASDKEGFKKVTGVLARTRKLRTEIERTRKNLKEDALEYCRSVDAEAKRITAAIVAIEKPLQDEKKKFENAEADRKLAELRAKVAAEEEKQRKIREETEARIRKEMEEKEAALKAEQERLEAERQQLAEQRRLLDEQQAAERARLAEEQRQREASEKAERERIAAEQEAERQRLEAQRLEQERIQRVIDERERIERERIEAEQRAEAERQAEAERARQAELRAAAERERLEALRPDIERLRELSLAIDEFKFPEVRDPAAVRLVDWARATFRNVAEELLKFRG